MPRVTVFASGLAVEFENQGNEKGQYEQSEKERDAAFIILSHN